MNRNQVARVHQGELYGWRTYFLENDLIRLAATPDIGGRIMAYDLGDYPFFFVDSTLAGKLFSPEENQGDGSLAAWKNYGGDKTWPAPQGWERDDQWHGPPDPILDTGRYTLDEIWSDGEKASLSMTSPPDPRTGIQVSRRFAIQAGSTRVAVRLSFRNVSHRPVRWSIWDVVQLDAHSILADGNRAYDPTCTVTTRLNPNSRHPRGFHVMFGNADNSQWQTIDGLFVANYQWEIGKVGIDTPCGWIAFSRGSRGVVFAERFPYDPAGDYPDNGSTVECWTVGAGRVANLDYAESGIYLMETEVLSPLFTILPGKTASFTLEWGSCCCPGSAVDVTEAGVITTPFVVTRNGEGVRLSGCFGVFDIGELELVCLDEFQMEVHRDLLGPAHPLTAAEVNCAITPPANAHRIELRVATHKGPRFLAAAEIS